MIWDISVGLSYALSRPIHTRPFIHLYSPLGNSVWFVSCNELFSCTNLFWWSEAIFHFWSKLQARPKRKFWLTWVSSFSSLTFPRFTALMLIFKFSSSTWVSIIARRGVTMIAMLFPSHWLNHELLTPKQCLVQPDKLKTSYVQLARW